jgi:acyl carrier protein
MEVTMEHIYKEDEIKAYLRVTIAELLERPEWIVDLTDNTMLDDYYNSITIVSFMIQIEEKFNIRYEPHEMGVGNFSTIQILADFISNKLYSTQVS